MKLYRCESCWKLYGLDLDDEPLLGWLCDCGGGIRPFRPGAP